MEEIWKDIGEIKGIDYTGLYQVSNYGQVRSLDRYDNLGRFVKGRILKPKIYKVKKYPNKIYLKVDLSKNNIAIHFSIHRLEAIFFELPIPEHLKDIPIEELEVDHIDTNPLNNRLDNLRWTDDIGNANNPLTRQHMSEAHKVWWKKHKEK